MALEAVEACDVEVAVRIADGRVEVVGASSCAVYDLSGRRMPEGVRLTRGVYVVVADGVARRVSIR